MTDLNEEFEPIFNEELGRDFQVLTLMRIYDVLIALLYEQNSERAKMMVDLHQRGGFVQPPPNYNPDEMVIYREENNE